eukprot:2106232-Amphidinium_carterae.1
MPAASMINRARGGGGVAGEWRTLRGGCACAAGTHVSDMISCPTSLKHFGQEVLKGQCFVTVWVLSLPMVSLSCDHALPDVTLPGVPAIVNSDTNTCLAH